MVPNDERTEFYKPCSQCGDEFSKNDLTRNNQGDWLCGDCFDNYDHFYPEVEDECEVCKSETCDGCVSPAGLKFAEEIRQIKEDEEEHWRVVQENARYEDMLRVHNIEEES